ncbi:MAG: redox-sensing transcriptional repressor Rex [Bacteroidales bacterium]
MKSPVLPPRTIERLSEYRRSLLEYLAGGKPYIFSHELAALHHYTPEQVRRDIMLIGYSSFQRKGYDVKKLIRRIAGILDTPRGINVAVVGFGNLGHAITNYFRGKRSKLNIIASFDNDPGKVGKVTLGVVCYPVEQLHEIIREKRISIAVLTVPPEAAREITARLVHAGIRGILNYTSVPLQVPENVFVESYDFITFLEKVAYFVKLSGERE